MHRRSNKTINKNDEFLDVQKMLKFANAFKSSCASSTEQLAICAYVFPSIFDRIVCSSEECESASTRIK